MKSHTVQGISVVLPLLLIVVIFLPVPMIPYQDSPEVSFGISHESTEAFNDAVTDRTAARESAIPVEELFESQRQAFETAKDQGTFSPTVCKSRLLICDEYPNVPEPPSKGPYMTYAGSAHAGGGEGYHYEYGMTEDTDGDLYLVRVGSMYDSWNFSFLLEPLSKLLSLGVFAGFLVSRNWSGPDPTPTDVRYGFTLLAFVLALPYLLMVPNVTSTELWSLYAVIGLPVITWIVILAEHLREI